MSGRPACRTTRVQRASFAPGQRVLMVSDIHGHDTVFRSLLQKAAFGPDDALVVVGDLLEKGAESLKVIRTLMALQGTHRVYTLLGNMDVFTVWRLLTDDKAWRDTLFDGAANMTRWWGGCLLHEMLDEMGIPRENDLDRDRVTGMIRERFAPELAFMSGLPTILDAGPLVFAHGGLPHLDVDAFEGTLNEPFLKRDDFLSEGLSFDRWLVVGHWPTVLYRDRLMDMSPLILPDRHIVCLDGGCGVKRSGQLNCVILPDCHSDDFTFLWEDGLPRVTALDAQDEGPEPVYIKWHDRCVRVLDRGEGFSRARSHGREFRVPTELLPEGEEGLLEADYTDYRLPVRPGDELSLIRVVNGDAYVRNDSVIGWYGGAFRRNE